PLSRLRRRAGPAPPRAAPPCPPPPRSARRTGVVPAAAMQGRVPRRLPAGRGGEAPGPRPPPGPSGGRVELRFLGRAGQRGHARGAALDHGGHVVEVAGAHFLLVRDKGVALLARGE